MSYTMDMAVLERELNRTESEQIGFVQGLAIRLGWLLHWANFVIAFVTKFGVYFALGYAIVSSLGRGYWGSGALALGAWFFLPWLAAYVVTLPGRVLIYLLTGHWNFWREMFTRWIVDRCRRVGSVTGQTAKQVLEAKDEFYEKIGFLLFGLSLAVVAIATIWGGVLAYSDLPAEVAIQDILPAFMVDQISKMTYLELIFWSVIALYALKELFCWLIDGLARLMESRVQQEQHEL